MLPQAVPVSGACFWSSEAKRFASISEDEISLKMNHPRVLS